MPKTIEERTTGHLVQATADEWEQLIEGFLDNQWNGESCEVLAVQAFPNECVKQELENRYAKAGFQLTWNPAEHGKRATVDVFKQVG